MQEALIFRMLVRYVDIDGIFGMLDESHPAHKMELLAIVAIGVCGKPWKRARTCVFFQRMAFCALREVN